MKKFMVSVCIPVYNSEKFLMFCLESIVRQTFKDFEIIIVNDGSNGTDLDGNSCKKIVKLFKKKNKKIAVTYIEHSKNKSLLEARRTAVYASQGEYIFTVDSDDFLPPDALEILVNQSENKKIDIIQGASVAGYFPENAISAEYPSFIPTKQNFCGSIYIGTINQTNLFYEYFIKKSFSALIWAKLIRRECYLEALDKIPLSQVNLNEELLQMFFIIQNVKSYKGVNSLVYYYRRESGMTSIGNTVNLEIFRQRCSATAAFSIIYLWLEEQKTKNGEYPFTPEIIDSIRDQINLCVYTCICSMNSVEEKNRAEAYKILCEYWGEKYINHILEIIENQKKI